MTPRLPGRRRLGRNRIVTRLIGLVLLVALVTGGVTTWLIARSARHTLRSEIGERSAAIVQGMAVRLDGRLETVTDALRLVASRDAVVGLQPSAGSDLRVALGVSPIFDELILFDGRGEPVAAAANLDLADPATHPARPQVTESFLEGQAGVELPATAQLINRFPPIAEITVPVEFPPGTPVGALVGRLSLEVLAEPVVRLDPSTGAVSFLVGPDGDVVVHPERDRVADGEQFAVGAELQRDGWALVDHDGGRSLVAAAPTRLLGGRVVVQQAEQRALAPVDERTRELLATIAAVLAPAAAVLLIGGSLLLRPLRPLARAVERLGRGERGVRVDDVGRGEIGDLAAEFNRLAEAIDQRDEEIDQLQRLSLLVSAGADRDRMLDVVAGGTARLLTADGAAYHELAENGPARLSATAGEVRDLDETHDLAAVTIRTGELRTDVAGPRQLLAVPVERLDGTLLGVLSASRTGEPFSAREQQLATAFAAFAGVALENARRLELEQQLAQELQDAVDRRRDLISRITHEFRTPLMCVSGFSAALDERWTAYDEDQRRSLIHKIREHSDELDELVGGLLDFAVTERSTLAIELQPTDLQTAIQAAVEGLRPVLGEREVRVEADGLQVVADQALLRRTLTNLLSNAAKYSPPGSPVRVRAIPVGGEVRVEVIDRGLGMTASEASQAFAPFWRSRSSAVRAVRGAGLGLPLVAEYVRIMGGATGVVSEPGRGSSFFFTLRRASHHPTDPHPPAPAGAPAR